MPTKAARRPRSLLFVCAVTLTVIACKGDDKTAKTDPERPPATEEMAKSDDDADEPADAADADAKADAADPSHEAADATDAKADDDAKADAPAAADDTGPVAAADAPPGDEAGAPDTKALLTEVKAKKTKDDRALAALSEAEAGGVEIRELAKAANARGLSLHATPDRAKQFFEWALDKDPKYPDAAFNLAKQAAVLGEVDETKKWLTETRERGGKKLVQQIDFDPMWEIVKDDPDVRALLK